MFLDPRGDETTVAEFTRLLIAEENGVLAKLTPDGVGIEVFENALVIKFRVFLLPVLEEKHGGERCELGIALSFPIARGMKADCDCAWMGAGGAEIRSEHYLCCSQTRMSAPLKLEVFILGAGSNRRFLR